MLMRKASNAAVAAAMIMALPGCGGSRPSQTDIAGTDGGDDGTGMMNGAARSRGAQPAGAQQGTADAEGIDCGSLPAPGSGDVVGVTLGMSADDAYRVVACSNRALRLAYNNGGFQVPPMPDGRRPRTMLVGQTNGEMIEVALAGLPGQERVIFIRRSVTYAPGQEPQAAALAQQLRTKYGELTERQGFANAYNAALVRETPRASGEIRNPCAPPTVSRLEMYPYCLPSVTVQIDFSPTNPQLAGKLIVATSDGVTGMRLLDEYRMAASGAAQERQNQEAGQAAGRTPTL